MLGSGGILTFRVVTVCIVPVTVLNQFRHFTLFSLFNVFIYIFPLLPIYNEMTILLEEFIELLFMREECSLLLNGADHNDAKIGIFVLYFFMLSTPNKKF